MWTKEKYESIINTLFELSDSKYRDFSNRLIIDSKEIIGVNIPELRKLAKDISKTEIESFFKFYKGYYFEETMILGLVLGYLKEVSILKQYILFYSKEIADWSLCDTPASNMKLIKNYNKEFYPIIETFLNSDEEFIIRFGLVLLLNHYINDEYIDNILNICINLKTDKYYINMAISWLLCECYIKYKEKTDKYISFNYLDKFVLNKTISKIRDSYRVNNIDKEELKKRRI